MRALPYLQRYSNVGIVAVMVFAALLMFITQTDAPATYVSVLLAVGICIFSVYELTPARVVLMSVTFAVLISLPMLVPVILGAVVVAFVSLPFVGAWWLSELMLKYTKKKT